MGLRKTGLRNKHSGERYKFLGAAVLTVITVLSGGIGIYMWATAVRPPVRDQATFCPVEGPRAVTVMVLDTSDAFPKPTKHEIFKLLTDIADDLPDYALLDIRVLDPAYEAGRSVFALCNPGDGRGLNDFTGNPALAKRRWKERFREPLEKALDGGLQPQRSDSSPLLATLQGIAIERFTGKPARETPKSLVIVSDMIEHGKDYSQYRSDLSYDRFKRTPSYQKFRTDLHGAEVKILYAQRLTAVPINSAAHIRFWVDWVQDNNGRFSKAIKLQGAGHS